MTPSSKPERVFLEQKYAGRIVFHGELHDHAATGDTSDGKCSLTVWKREMQELKMDFAAILDHKQVRHMYLPEWDERFFICGSEPGTSITDSNALDKSLHYNMIVPCPQALEKVLSDFPEFEFTGGSEGHFKYPSFTRARFRELIDAVFDVGGFFVVPHPKQIMISDDPLDYWFRDYCGIEAFYVSPVRKYTADDTALWLELLKMGKRVWACAGGDVHSHPHNDCLTTVYAEEQNGISYLPYLRRGDFTCGSAGIKMVLGDTFMGGHCGFDGNVILSVGDFHSSIIKKNHTYRAEIWDENERLGAAPVSPDDTSYFTFEAPADRKLIRAEVWDELDNIRIALGNPIWNDR